MPCLPSWHSKKYDEATGKAVKKPRSLKRDVVGKTAPVTSVQVKRRGRAARVAQPARNGPLDLPFIDRPTRGKPRRDHHRRAGRSDLPRSYHEGLADRRPVPLRQRAGEAGSCRDSRGHPQRQRQLRKVQPEDVLPGDIDANLGAPWIPEADIRDFAAHLFGVPADGINVAHLKKDAVWSLDAGYAAEQSVAAKTEYGTARANGNMAARTCDEYEIALSLRIPTRPTPISVW